MTTREDISGWFDRGVENGATHMIVVCDTFDYDDYPVYVSPEEDVRQKVKDYSVNMQKVMEVYSMKHNKESQLNETRAFHYD